MEDGEDRLLKSILNPDKKYSEMLDRYEYYNHISAKTIDKALLGYETEILVNSDRLSKIFKMALENYGGNGFYFIYCDTDERYIGKTAIRRELFELTDKLEQINNFLSNLTPFSDSILRKYSFVTGQNLSIEEIEKRKEIESTKSGLPINFNTRVTELSIDAIELQKNLRNFRKFTLQAIESFCPENEKPRWRDRERRKIAIHVAIILSLIFEKITNESATLNSWPNADGIVNYGPWYDFFCRIGSLMLNIDSVPDSIGVLKAARSEINDKNNQSENISESDIDIDNMDMDSEAW